MLEKVKKYIESNQIITKGDSIIVGISGGADSVCLFFVLLELRESYNLKLYPVHVNHNLRGEDAKADQAYVEKLCQGAGISCVVVDADVKVEAIRRGRSLEETGRDIRQEAFAREAMKIQEQRKMDGVLEGNVKIATAHHMNDNVETMLMNLVRGTGISGLTGIAPTRDDRIRPLLCVGREEIEKYLEEKNTSYCIDKTNHENIYIRNVIRNRVIPILEDGVNERAVPHMQAAIDELTKIETYLKEQVDQAFASCVSMTNDDCELNKREMSPYPLILQERVIKRALEEVAKQQRDISRIHIEQVVELLDKQVGREVHLPYGLIGKRTYDGIQIRKGESKNQQNRNNPRIITRVLDICEFRRNYQEMQEDPYTKYFDYDIISDVPRLRTRQVGDQIVINGNGNKQKLKKYYITNKIPQDLREEIPVVAVGNEILWVVGYRTSNGYEITEKTKQILEIQYDGGNHGRNN
ncbi:MAG: tRNA lysidine(34) synthetase TilS [Eubacteriales bacterium]